MRKTKRKNKRRIQRIISLTLIVIAVVLIFLCIGYRFILEKKNEGAIDAGKEQDTVSSDSEKLFESFLNGDIDAYCKNEDGSGFYTANIKNFDIDGGEWDSYSVYGYLDADNDGEKELVLKGPYGACFFDAKDDKVTLFASGEGTGDTCLLSCYKNAYWIVNAHAGADSDDFVMRRYDGADTVAETFFFGAVTDENGNENYYKGDGTGREVSITKEEYTEMTDSFQPLSY